MSSGGYQIFFFPKNKIDSLMQKTVNSICEVMPLESVVKGVIRKILPKKSGGVRPLFRETAIHKKSRTLFEAKQLLRYLANKEQKRIASFPEVWQNALYMLGKESKLYFVKTDIKDAFSSVDVPQLLVQLYQIPGLLILTHSYQMFGELESIVVQNSRLFVKFVTLMVSLIIVLCMSGQY
ncbi:hypothetical protein E2C01_055220 [Portunus trituberculatus]|uniref:Reverse transcriptase domain-containing protein n=1 Tax=Portunus trituberculatus TaxID=210409 RepID=A0A5B7GU87_PORTR|nr:hypothetical protein [Portunus trituberculatus]